MAEPLYVEFRAGNVVICVVESTGVVPKGLEDLGRQHCFDTFPEELDKILDQSHIVFGLIFVVRVVELLIPGGLAWNIRDRLQDVEIVNGPGIENINTEVEIAVLESLSAVVDRLPGFGIDLVNAFCQLCDILSVIVDSFEFAVALVCVPDVVTKAQDAFVAIVSVGMILIAQNEVSVVV